MKQFKFRVRNIKKNEWVHGPDQEVFIFGECILLGAFMNGVRLIELDDCIVEQFSGFYDRNGKEIYTGDILSFENSYDEIIEGEFCTLNVVTFDRGCFKFEHGDLLCDLATKEDILKEESVIGNIHDNKNYLE